MKPMRLLQRERHAYSAWRKLVAQQPRNGTIQRLADSGTSSTATTFGLSSAWPVLHSPYVPSVVAITRAGMVDSARTPVSRNGVGHQDSMTSNESASSAGAPSWSTNTNPSDAAPVVVQWICDGGTVPVWDIEVDDPDYPEFIAEGVLIHNSLRYGLMGTSAVSQTARKQQTWGFREENPAKETLAERRRRR
jgi:hypothetical protein